MNIELSLPIIILGLLIGVGVRVTMALNKRAKRKRAEEDAKALTIRANECMAAYHQLNPDDWPHELDPAIAKHRHYWNASGDCFCGAHLDHGLVYTFNRGQVVTVNGGLHRVVMLNVMGCGHWVLDGFPETEMHGEFRHFTSAELLGALRGEQVMVRED
jgi:hypothetical protein